MTDHFICSDCLKIRPGLVDKVVINFRPSIPDSSCAYCGGPLEETPDHPAAHLLRGVDPPAMTLFEIVRRANALKHATFNEDVIELARLVSALAEHLAP